MSVVEFILLAIVAWLGYDRWQIRRRYHKQMAAEIETSDERQAIEEKETALDRKPPKKPNHGYHTMSDAEIADYLNRR